MAIIAEKIRFGKGWNWFYIRINSGLRNFVKQCVFDLSLDINKIVI